MIPHRLGKWGSLTLPLSTCTTRQQVCCHSAFTKRWISCSAYAARDVHAALRPINTSPDGRRWITAWPNRRMQCSKPSELKPKLSAVLGASTTDGERSSPLPSSTTAPTDTTVSSNADISLAQLPPEPHLSLESLPSPPPSRLMSSAKLSAMHSRLSLPQRLSIQTLGRCLVDRTADPDARFNNLSLSILGDDLLSYYMTEHLLVHFPRLPKAVLDAAVYGYVGQKTLAAVSDEWGLEAVAEPGGEVDPGLLQFKRKIPGGLQKKTRNIAGVLPKPFDPTESAEQREIDAVTRQLASARFVRALFASVYLHCGARSCHAFFTSHILPRKLDVSAMFTFAQPTRDLSRLCAREGFDSPVARLESETGRLSRHPVFVVGVYSGVDKLGEGVGPSLHEARFKAAVNALKGWYLYSPVPEDTKPAGGLQPLMVPSMLENNPAEAKNWQPAVIDYGEVVA